MSKKMKITLISVFAALVIIVGIVAVAMNHKTTQSGGKKFTIQITSERDSYDETKEYSSDAEFLGQFLRTLEGCEYSESDYGIYITGFNGMNEDMDNQYWWCVNVNGEAAMTGADEIPLADGDAYSFVLMQGW